MMQGKNHDRGKFITFEGVDGSGKTTQVMQLVQYLQDNGHHALALREPGGTKIGESIRLVLLEKANIAMVMETELLLFAAARAQLVREIIQPSLEQGTWIICDRFLDSTLAYQGFGRGLDLTLIRQINAIAVGTCLPDLTLWMDLPIQVAYDRLMERSHKSDRLDLEDLAFMERTRQGYELLLTEEPHRMIRVDAGLPQDELAHHIQTVIREGIGL